MKRILFLVTRADTIGGAQIHVKDMASRLMRDGVEVLVATGAGETYPEALHREGVPSVQLPGLGREIDVLGDFRAMNAFRRLVLSFQPDLVSTHSAKAGLLGRLAARSVGVPCLYTAHGWVFGNRASEPRNSLYRWLEKTCEPLTEKLICVSEQVRQAGLNAGMRPDRLVTIHNGMPDVPDSLKAVARQEGPIRIVMVGRFQEPKDQAGLVRALEGIGGFTLEFVGDGPSEEEVRALVRAKGLGARVQFSGFCRNVDEKLAAADLFVLVSHQEGFPRSILEAMRAGLPVIASDVGGVREAVVNGKTGFVIPPGDEIVLRDRILKTLNHAEQRLAMGRAARMRYERYFTFERMYGRTVDVYDSVLAQREELVAT